MPAPANQVGPLALLVWSKWMERLLVVQKCQTA